MTINEFELCELLENEIWQALVMYDGYTFTRRYVVIKYSTFQDVALVYNGGQTYTVIDSNCNDMRKGQTINVNEILDIVL